MERHVIAYKPFPPLQMDKLRLREGKELIQVHPDSKRQHQVLNPGLLIAMPPTLFVTD